MFYNILDKKRLSILPLLNNFKKDFYLAGGTGLALQLGHRDSIDFDFFSKKDINTTELFLKIKQVFRGHKIKKVQEIKNTLTVFIDENIKLSFFTYKNRMLNELIEEEDLRIASILDIACMKLSAIISRATNKDYIDLYYIFKEIPLKNILKKVNAKIPELDKNLILKSLVYFKDINKEPIKFKNNKRISFSEIEKSIKKEVLSLES